MTLGQTLVDLLVEEDIFKAKGAIPSKMNVSIPTTSFLTWKRESCGEELCRLEIFERLGMAHTCCDIGPSPLACSEYFLPSEEECHELREVDNNFRQGLESCMCIYALLRREHIVPFSKFWCNWWTAVNDILPEESRDSHSPGRYDYVPNVNEIRLSVQSKPRKYDVEDREDILLGSFKMFLGVGW